MYQLLRNTANADDLLRWGYKMLGKNKAGQTIYKKVHEPTLLKGFRFRNCYPEEFQATSFVYANDAGRVTDQFVRKVGTVGSTASSERINISQVERLNLLEDRSISMFHMVESTPKAGKFLVWNERINPHQGIARQKVVLNANNQGKLENAIMQVEYKSPLVQGNKLEGCYDIEQNSRVTIHQNGVKKAKCRFFDTSPEYKPNAYVAEASIGEVRYPYSITELKKPGFYRQYTGPLKSEPS